MYNSTAVQQKKEKRRANKRRQGDLNSRSACPEPSALPLSQKENVPGILFELEIRVGGLLILKLGWERLSRSVLTAFRFWLEFRRTLKKQKNPTCSHIFCLEICEGGPFMLNLVRRGYLAHFWLLFDPDASFGNHFSTFFRLFIRLFSSFFLKSWNIVRRFFIRSIEFIVGVAISLTLWLLFDSDSSFGNPIFDLFSTFSRHIYVENSVEYFVLD